MLLLMFQNCGNHHLGCMEPCNQWDKLTFNWCRISSINSMTYFVSIKLHKIQSALKQHEQIPANPTHNIKSSKKPSFKKGLAGRNYRQGHVGHSKIGHRRNYPIPLYSLVDIWVPTRGYSTLRNERSSIIPFYKTQPTVAVLFFTVFRSGPVP